MCIRDRAKYIEAAAKHNADIIACSALLTTTMVHIKDVVKGVAESPLAGKVKICLLYTSRCV